MLNSIGIKILQLSKTQVEREGNKRYESRRQRLKGTPIGHPSPDILVLGSNKFGFRPRTTSDSLTVEALSIGLECNWLQCWVARGLLKPKICEWCQED